MTATPYPLPRETREFAILVGNGTIGPYGPSSFKLFDIADVVVLMRKVDEDRFSDVTLDATATKSTGAAFDTFSVTFDNPVPAATEFLFQSRRMHERQNAVTKGGAISANELEKELSKQGTVIEELRRDVDRGLAFQPDFNGDTKLPSVEPGKVVGWKADGSGLDNMNLADTTVPVPTTPNRYLRLDADGVLTVLSVQQSAHLDEMVEVDPGATGLGLLATTTPASARTLLEIGDAISVPSRAALKVINPVLQAIAVLIEAGREGTFIWRAGNLSSLVALDTREGIYVAPASDPTGASGAWVRLNERRFLVEWFGAVGDGVTNDGPAINAALTVVGIGGKVELLDKIYATSETISVHRDGQRLLGRMAGHTFSVAPSASEGTVLKWIGAAGGTLAYFGCQPGGTADMSGGGIENVQFNGNLLADKCLHIRSCSFSTFRGLRPFNARDNTSAVCLLLDSDTATRPGINSIYRCNFYNTAIATGGAAATGLLVTGAIDEIGGQHTAFVSFHGLHVTHDDGDAIKITAADDMLFADIGISKAAGGTGISVHIKPNANRGVVGLTFIQIYLGSNDVPEFRADASNAGAICHGIFIYGLSGVDQAATVTEMGGATIEVVDYTGTVYNPDPAVRGAYRKTPPMKVGNYASADDATLDYYKERLGNVTLTFGGAAVGMTMSNNFYRSTRIGNLVHFKAQIALTAKGSSTGAAVISGLPYSAVDGWALAISATAMTSGVGDTHLSAITNNSSVGLSKMATGSETSLTHADFTNTSVIVISGVYQTSDAAA